MDEKETSGCSCCSTTKTASPCNCTGQVPEARDIQVATSTITTADRLDHFLARWGWNRGGHRVDPGLYRLGNPGADSPVFASANYSLSFDALRSALNGKDSWILVLDTKGINVWCAAGKGTFGSDELVRRIEASGLPGMVSHRKIIVPQLSAPGVSWPEVMRRSGFSVEYGPVRASDLPEYLRTRTATPPMREVRFPLRDRLVLIPVEFVHVLLPMIVAAVVLYFLAGPVAALTSFAAVIAGTALFPALLPVIPTSDFSSKGFILGAIVALPFTVAFAGVPAVPLWVRALAGLIPLLIIPAVIAYIALNFTGATTFTSRTGVKKEIFRYVPVMVLMAGSGTVLGILLGISRLTGVI
jgi:hypothetical protein